MNHESNFNPAISDAEIKKAKDTAAKMELLEARGFRFEKPGHYRDSYDHGKLIGQGAHAKVHLCQEIKTGAFVAVKMMEKRLLKPDEQGRYMKEIYLVRALDNPYIINVIEYFQDKERYYMIMEYCKGGELFHEIN